jgi:hypothetical protein
MSSPTPPQSSPQQFAAPESAPAPQETGTAQPAQQPGPPPARQESIEDRILKPHEVESLLRGIDPAGTEEPPTSFDAEQAGMAEQWMRELSTGPVPAGPAPVPNLPGEVAPSQVAPPEPAAPVAPQAPPAWMTPEQRAQAAAAQQQTAPQPVAPPPQQVPVQPSPALEALQAQNYLLTAQINSMQQQLASLAQRPAPSAPTPAAQQQATTPGYNFNVPDQYINALNNEDINVRRAALNGLLNGVAQGVSQQVRSEMDQRFAGVPQTVNSIVSESSRAQSIHQDMYGTYPELSPVKHFVQAAVSSIAPNLDVNAWTPDLRDMIAERVAPMIPGLAQKIQAQRSARMQSQLPQPYFPVAQQPIPTVPNGNGSTPVPAAALPPNLQGRPLYVRDASGALVPYTPQQQFVAGQQTRPGSLTVDPQLQDIWTTLNY